MMDAWINSEKIGRKETSLFGGGLRLNSERASVLETRFGKKGKIDYFLKFPKFIFSKSKLTKKGKPCYETNIDK